MRSLAQPFQEDMGRKAKWFSEIHGTSDRDLLDRVRDAALEHVEVMRAARVTRLDPGGGAPDTAVVLVGAGRGSAVVKTTQPGPIMNCFVTAPVEVTATGGDLAATLKQRLRRGALQHLDPRTARMFRWDAQREAWQIVDASGWNAEGRYVWGRVDRPGTYAAVSLPKEGTALRRVALESLARRTVRDAVTTGHFASVADFGDRGAFRDYFVDRHHVDLDSADGKRRVKEALQAHRATVRELGREWAVEPLGGNPQWAVLEDIMLRLEDIRAAIGLDHVVPFWPIIARVANRVGPWFPLGPVNVNGRVKSLAMHPSDSNVLYAGSANGGVWKSTNGGLGWQSLWKFQDSMAVGAIATAPSNGSVVYAATGEDTPGYGPSYGGVGVFRSGDAGKTWAQVGTAADVGNGCNKVLVHPASSRRVFVASNTGVHRGQTIAGIGSIWAWQRLLPGRATDLVLKHDNPTSCSRASTTTASTRQSTVESTGAGLKETRSPSSRSCSGSARRFPPAPTQDGSNWQSGIPGRRGQTSSSPSSGRTRRPPSSAAMPARTG